MIEDELNGRQTQAILALLTTKTLADAAKKAGVAESTLREWLGQPAFAARLRTARGEVIDRTVTALVRVSLQAVAELERNLDPKKPPEVQVRAAKALLDRFVKVVALADLQAQVDDLRAQIASAAAGLEPAPRPTPGGVVPLPEPDGEGDTLSGE
ncbi:hypothetical protein J0H58_18375 [bacterium]|nr:hypothetical protein [bacterium]